MTNTNSIMQRLPYSLSKRNNRDPFALSFFTKQALAISISKFKFTRKSTCSSNFSSVRPEGERSDPSTPGFAGHGRLEGLNGDLFAHFLGRTSVAIRLRHASPDMDVSNGYGSGAFKSYFAPLWFETHHERSRYTA